MWQKDSVSFKCEETAEEKAVALPGEAAQASADLEGVTRGISRNVVVPFYPDADSYVRRKDERACFLSIVAVILKVVFICRASVSSWSSSAFLGILTWTLVSECVLNHTWFHI